MASVNKVYFPAPPPTSNTLTPAERACLRKSTSKLGRLLGVTPRVLDVDDFDDVDSSKLKSTSNRRRTRAITHHAGSSLSRLPSLTRNTINLNSQKQTSSTFSLVDDARTGNNPMENNNPTSPRMNPTPNHPRGDHPPALRMARLLLTRVSSHHVSDLDFPSSESDNDDDYLDEEDESRLASVRRKKMERLHRILGEEVPISVVFPQYGSDESGSDSDGGSQKRDVDYRRQLTVEYSFGLDSRRRKTLSTTPSPRSDRKVAAARNSMDLSTPSPHKVLRKESSSSSSLPHYRLRSSHLTTTSEAQPDSDPRALRTICESPDEMDGLVEICGERSLSPSISDSSLRSEWYSSDDEENDDGRTEETLVELERRVVDVHPEVAARPKRVWSHKRKPPPVYEP